MSNFKEKTQIFIIGLMVGLIIAGGFFVLKLDDYFKELNFYKSFAKTFSTDSKVEEPAIKKEDNKPVEEKLAVENKTKTTKTGLENSGVKKDFVMDADTLNNTNTKDSAIADLVNSDDIVVRKDELLSAKTTEVINLNPVANKGASKDSLLQKVSGVKDDRSNEKQLFNIEFWQSPLNYKGYKMSKYKIVLYGITAVDAIKIYKMDDTIYLKNGAAICKLDYSGEFKPYERVTDENIISKLK